MITLLAASFRGRRFILEGGGTGTAACAGAGEGCWGQGGHCQPLPTSPSLMYSVSDSSQLPWDFGIMDTLGAVLINPGDVDPPGVVTVTTPPQPPPPPERAGRCLPAATADLQLTGKSTHPIKGSLRLLLSIANSRLSRGKPPVSPVGVWALGANPAEESRLQEHLPLLKDGLGSPSSLGQVRPDRAVQLVVGMACGGAGIGGFSLESDPLVDFPSLSSSPRVGSASKTTPVWL